MLICSTNQADEKDGQVELEEEAGENAEKDGAWYGERLKAGVKECNY